MCYQAFIQGMFGEEMGSQQNHGLRGSSPFHGLPPCFLILLITWSSPWDTYPSFTLLLLLAPSRHNCPMCCFFSTPPCGVPLYCNWKKRVWTLWTGVQYLCAKQTYVFACIMYICAHWACICNSDIYESKWPVKGLTFLLHINHSNCEGSCRHILHSDFCKSGPNPLIY